MISHLHTELSLGDFASHGGDLQALQAEVSDADYREIVFDMHVVLDIFSMSNSCPLSKKKVPERGRRTTQAVSACLTRVKFQVRY